MSGLRAEIMKNKLLKLEVVIDGLFAPEVRRLVINTNDIIGVFPWDTYLEDCSGFNDGYMLLAYSYYSHGKRNIEKYYIKASEADKIWREAI